MPDLTGIPSGVSAPLLIAFAVLLLIERLIGVSEKYRTWKKNKHTSDVVPSPENNEKDENQSIVQPKETVVGLSNQAMFGYSFIGAVFIPLVNLIVLSILVRSSVFIESYAYNLLSSMVFAILSSLIIVFYLSKKYQPIRRYTIVCIISGLAVSAMIAMPVNITITSITVNKNFQ